LRCRAAHSLRSRRRGSAALPVMRGAWDQIASSCRGVLSQTVVIGLVLLSHVLSQPWIQAQNVLPAAASFRNDRISVKPKAGADLRALHATTGSRLLKEFP